MNTKTLLLPCLCLSLSPAVWAEDAVSNEPLVEKKKAAQGVFSGSLLKVRDENGKVMEGRMSSESVITLGDNKYAIVEYDKPEDDGFGLHGNWLTEYKVEHFKNEGTGGNTRPVHEWVFGDGRVNLGDTGFNLGFLLKKVSFENDLNTADQDETDFRMTELELRPAYAKHIGKHWFMFEAIYLGKTGYEKNNWGDDTSLIGGDGYGFRPYYRYQVNDKFAFNTDLKWLTEDKDANGADLGKFVFYEALFNFNYQLADNLTAGVEFFYKDGNDYDTDGVKGANTTEVEVRPWVSWRLDQHNLFFKIEPNDKTVTQADGRTSYESTAVKYIFNYSYPITDSIYFVSEYFYRVETDKVIDGNSGYDDTITNFGKIGLNFVF
ncbi:hypothetical protein [Psychromonas ossibalaenae]|uniref:hypothetical protein n=1 Tax=Psychromonas ossibalaenae TaxID=444922 RepID=UPI000378F253|nr:hypothetical protein [Psychromonas ossibalaenae]